MPAARRPLVFLALSSTAAVLAGCDFASRAVYPSLTGMEDLRHPPVGAAPQPAPGPVIPAAPATSADMQALRDKLANIRTDTRRIFNGWESATRAINLQKTAYEKARADAGKSAEAKNAAQAELTRLSNEIHKAEGVASEAGGPAAALAQLIAAVAPMRQPEGKSLADDAQAALIDFGNFIETMARANKGYEDYLSAETAALGKGA